MFGGVFEAMELIYVNRNQQVVVPPSGVGVVERVVTMGEDSECAGCLPKEAASIATGMLVLASNDYIIKGTHFVI